MPTPRQCAECGASLPNDAPDGLCPTCGLRAALKVDPEAAAPFRPSALFDPPAQAAPSLPPHPSLSPTGREGARRAGEGDAQPQSAIANPKSAIGKLRYFGDYELLEEIARGGMGVVYRARQLSLNRTVAVKMILAGQLASAADVQRFRTEAEAAANLQHPNIVAIHEVGEHDGQHYFSMDYVEGRDLARLISDLRSPIPDFQRTGRYVKAIAEAIQYAHDHGTLHRDLKPSNVLIDANDEPRITDFGLAKRLSSKSEIRNPKSEIDLTLSGQVLGSPNFMPPEQAAGKRGQVGPHSDVYSLGAILYHLLTARPPFLAETLTETLQQVQHTDPILPRLLNPAVPRDLETICLKCLEKEPRRRYENASALAMDIQRYLNHEPVAARPPTRLYRLQKLVRRNKLAFAAAAAIAIALVSGLAVAAWGLMRERAARASAEAAEKAARTEAAKSQQVAQFFKEMLQSVRPSVALGRDTTLMQEILDKAVLRVPKELTNQVEIQAELYNSIGIVYLELARYREAEEILRKSLAIRRKLFGNEHLVVRDSLANLMVALGKQGKINEAEATAREGLAITRRLLGNESAEVAGFLNDVAGTLERRGKLAEAETLFRDALQIRRKTLGSENPEVAQSLANLANALSARGKLAEAESTSRQGLMMRKKLFGTEHPDVARSLNDLALVLQKQGKLTEAEGMGLEAVTLYRKLFPVDHPDVLIALQTMADVFDQEHKALEAEGMYRDALAMQRRLVGKENTEVARTLNNLAMVLEPQGKLAEAAELLRESLAIVRRTRGHERPEAATLLSNLSVVLRKQGNLEEAEITGREALSILRKVRGNEDRDVARLLNRLALVLEAAGKLDDAEAKLREALALHQKLLGNKHPEATTSLENLANALYKQAKYAEAEPLYREVLQIRLARLDAGHESVLVSKANLARLLCEWAWAERDSQSQIPDSKSEIVERACEAESLLRDCLAIRLRGTNASHWRTADVRSRLGGALLAVAVTDSSLTSEARQSKLAEAEALLLESNERLQRSKSAERKYKRDALERLVRLYQAWDSASPNTGKVPQAEEWNTKLEALRAEREGVPPSK
jgi:tetratricopeptide (TPR) repeat protein/tRNA A-37 threonylcarbamoyl transferase component Bud32